MTKRINFQFDDELKHQSEAIKSTIELFRGVYHNSIIANSIYKYEKKIDGYHDVEQRRNENIVIGTKLFENLKKVQFDNNLFYDEKLAGNNFTIEMETGTGKTYVYLRTILELYKNYNFKKFMIVVPSVAIRKGVEKSITQLQDHFKRLYSGLDILKHSFVYDSNNLDRLDSDFIENTDLSICVLNIQAFNSSKSNKIRNEDEWGRILWNKIKELKPIVIIDEPQRMEGDKKKKSKALQAIDELEPLFILRYSATHKNYYNRIYKLDSYDAYKNKLVKQITVKTVNGVIQKDFPYIRYVKFTENLKARIEMFSQKQGDAIRFKSFDVSSGDSLEELSGGLAQYKNMYIAEAPHKNKPLKISTNNEMLELEINKSNNGLEDIEAIRIQIRLAINNHFEKQFSILETGEKIKALTLFFIDSVDKVRDNTASDGRGIYLQIFDEEYKIAIKNYKSQLEKYKEYFPKYDDVLNIREGYFAIDNKNNIVNIDENEKINSKSQENIDRAISLILEKKDELISFDEPLSFIFSHSALREGWDNPNIFTLCMLKSGSSLIAKKQEIGRGLRLPVDIYGNRCTDENINELTVIANDSYENFSRELQDDFNNDMNFDKNEVTSDILLKVLKKAGVPYKKVTGELANQLKNEFMTKGLINNECKLNKDTEEVTKILDDIVFENEILNEHKKKKKNELIKIMIEKGSNRIEIKNGDNPQYENSIRAFVAEDDFKDIYFGLYEKLKKRTIYKCNIDKDKFVDDCVNEINLYLRNFTIDKPVYIDTSKANFNDAQLFELKKVDNNSVSYVEADIQAIYKTDLEIVNYIMYHTMLPRLSIFNILKGIEKRDALNFQDILDEITQKISNILNNSKANGISSYEVIDGYNLDEGQIFALDTINENDFDNEWKVFKSNPNKKRALNEYYKMDSAGEKEFAQKLENNDNVLLFTKLKKGSFIIDTPYGKYSPDWAIVYKKDDNQNVGIYFIVETKINKEKQDLTDVEKSKIKCAELHFKAVSDLVKFDWVSSYEDFKIKFGVKDSF